MNRSSRTAKVVPAKFVVRMRVTEQIFKSHPELTEEDVRFGADVVLSQDMSDQQFAMFVLLASRYTNTGRFALTYNEDLNDAVKNRDRQMVSNIINSSKESFVELFDNPDLTGAEKETVEKMMNREYLAIFNTLKMGEEVSLPMLQEFIPCKKSIEAQNVQTGSGMHSIALYGNCYDDVCLAESGEPVLHEIPEKVYTIDMPKDFLSPIIHCFYIMDVVKTLSIDNPPLNPETNQPFSELALDLLRKKYSKEVKMYRRYIEQ